jgi:hypothetical protein
MSQRRKITLVAAAIVLVTLVGGIGWAVWWLNDNIDAPGPAATGSGPCSSADSVNIQLVFADGHTVLACTHDRPACPSQTAGGTAEFGLHNQLRSSSRRYILTVSFNAALPADAPEQTLQINPQGFLPGPPGPGPSGNGSLSAAVVQVTPRDPAEDGYTPGFGTVTVSSSHGVAQGQIDGTFSAGPTRPDRPTTTPVSPIRVTGTFACNQ